MSEKKVVDLKGEEVRADEHVDGALLELARDFLADVQAGRVKVAAVATDHKSVGWTGPPMEVLGILSRAQHEVNLDLDELVEEDDAAT